LRRTGLYCDASSGVAAKNIEFEIMSRSTKLTSIEDVLEDLPSSPVSSSRGRNWPGVTIDLDKSVEKIDLSLAPRDHHVVFLPLQTSTALRQVRAGQQHTGIVSPGTAIIMPAGLESEWTGFQPAITRIRILPFLVADAVEEMSEGSERPVEIRNEFCSRDDDIVHLGAVLRSELDKAPHPAQPLLVGAVSSAVVLHLIRRYDAFAIDAPIFRAGLDPISLKQVLDYIEAHPDADITLDNLAKMGRVSRFHFTRLFRQSMGVTPMAYVERSRILLAQQLIRTTQRSMADIAYACGFADQSYFVRRFRKYLECTPSDYRRRVRTLVPFAK
jgi:AraC family transcriptional regulator